MLAAGSSVLVGASKRSHLLSNVTSEPPASCPPASMTNLTLRSWQCVILSSICWWFSRCTSVRTIWIGSLPLVFLQPYIQYHFDVVLMSCWQGSYQVDQKNCKTWFEKTLLVHETLQFSIEKSHGLLDVWCLLSILGFSKASALDEHGAESLIYLPIWLWRMTQSWINLKSFDAPPNNTSPSA